MPINIWFMQLKKPVLETNWNHDDALLFMSLCFFYLENEDTVPFVDSPDFGVTSDRAIRLGWLGKDLLPNREMFSNSKHDRDFKRNTALIDARRFGK